MSNFEIDSKSNLDERSLTQLQSLSAVRSEREYLALQAEEAKNAMTHTLTDMKTTLLQAADLRLWTKRHPFIVLGSAVAAGLIAGATLASRKHAKKMHKRSPSELPLQAGVITDANGGKPKKSVLFAILGTIAASLFRTAVRRSIAALVSGPSDVKGIKHARRPVAHNHSRAHPGANKRGA